MNHALEQRILDLYDAEVAKHPEGIKTAEAQLAIADDVAELLADEPRDLTAEVAVAIRATVGPDRERRARRIKQELEYILDYFVNPEEAALVPDDRMNMAIRLGEADGTDKTLRYWTVSDFVAMGQYRRQRAQEAVDAAEELNRVIGDVVKRMRAAEAHRFGDVDWSRN